MKCIRVYKFAELKSEIQKKVIERSRNSRISDSEIPWRDEITDSLKALIGKTNGAKLRDYSLGLEQSDLKVDLGDANDLTGSRALGWLENNLLSNLRMSRREYLKKRKDNFRYGYRVDAIPCCPLTGCCFDQDFLEDLSKSLREGRSLKEAFQDLSHVYERLLQSEYDGYVSEENIKEDLENQESHYTKEGKEI